MIDSGLLEPGKGKVYVTYKGVTYHANLRADGTIEFNGKVFTAASAFSVHVKRLQTPNKAGDDGWKSVHIEGRALEYWRDVYFEAMKHAQRLGGGPTAVAAAIAAAIREAQEEEGDEDEEEDLAYAGQGSEHLLEPQLRGSFANTEGRRTPIEDERDEQPPPQQEEEAVVSEPAPRQGPARRGRAKPQPEPAPELQEDEGVLEPPPPPPRPAPSRKGRGKAAQPEAEAEAAGGSERAVRPAAGRKARGKAVARPEPEPEPEEEEEEEDGAGQGEEDDEEGGDLHWVQCSRCHTWRVVPDEAWAAIERLGNRDWFCQDAKWDLKAFTPHTSACRFRG